MRAKYASILMAVLLVCSVAKGQVKPPTMGWSSWYNYQVNVNEKAIRDNVDAFLSKGFKDAGYRFINIDDGFFGGRDEQGNLLYNGERFPNGMKALVKYIHKKGLKAGIYTDGGINTCGCVYDRDTISVGCGLYGHEEKDLKRYLLDWGYDFIKIDWCGGDWMGLDDKERYTMISGIVRRLRADVVLNVCRWRFPGAWVTGIADSWRISADIQPNFKTITRIIDLNADLWIYCSPGHYNDMDMLQVGRGMSYEEDKAHFSMWCMMVSPLMTGADLINIDARALEILTNREVIALNQDPLFYQARRLRDDGDLELWAKPLKSTMSGEVAVALLNRSDSAQQISFKLSEVGLEPSKGCKMRNLWTKQDYPLSRDYSHSFEVPSHGVVLLRLKGAAMPYNVFQRK